MKKLFPNIETAIIFVFILCVILWGVTRCNRKKEDMTIRAVTEGAAATALQDSIISSSPAARSTPTKPVVTTPVVPPPPPTDPNSGTLTTPQYQQPPQVQNPTQVAQNPTVNPTLAKPQTATPPNVSNKAVTAEQPSGTMLYVLINGLNVRTKPDLKAKSLGKLKVNDQVFFLNEVTPEAQTVRLADKTEVTNPWFKIKPKRGTVGWVHGSGVDFYKRKPQGDL